MVDGVVGGAGGGVSSTSLVPRYGCLQCLQRTQLRKAKVAIEVPSEFESVVETRVAFKDGSDHAETLHGSGIDVAELPTQVMDLVSERVDGCEDLKFKSSVSLLEPESSPLPDATSPTSSHMRSQHLGTAIATDTTDTIDTPIATLTPPRALHIPTATDHSDAPPVSRKRLYKRGGSASGPVPLDAELLILYFLIDAE